MIILYDCHDLAMQFYNGHGFRSRTSGIRTDEQNQTNPRVHYSPKVPHLNIFTRKLQLKTTNRNLTDVEMVPDMDRKLSSLRTTKAPKKSFTKNHNFAIVNKPIGHQTQEMKQTIIERLAGKFHNVVDSFDNVDATFRLNVTVDEDKSDDTELGLIARLAWMFAKPKNSGHGHRRRRDSQDEDVGRSYGTETEAEEEIQEYIEEQKEFNWTHHWLVCSTIIIVWVCWFVIAIGLCRQAASMSKKAALLNEA